MSISLDKPGGTSRRRAIPIIILLLVLAAVGIKSHFYLRQFFQHEELKGPLPVESQLSPDPVTLDHNQDYDQDYDHGHNPAYDHDHHAESSSHSATTHISTSTSQQPHSPTSQDHPTSTGQAAPSHPTPTIPPDPSHNGTTPPFRGKLRPPPNRMQYFKSEQFHAPNMTISKPGEASQGLLFCNPSTYNPKDAAPFIMTDDNELIWHGPSGAGTNTRVQMIDGEPHLTYWQTMGKITQGHGYGAIYVLDSSYNEVYKICPPGLDISVVRDMIYDCVLDMHVSLVTDRGTVLATAYNVTSYNLTEVEGPEQGWVYDAIFYEIDIKTQEVLFRWRSLDHLDEIPFDFTKMPNFHHHDDEEKGNTTGMNDVKGNSTVATGVNGNNTVTDDAKGNATTATAGAKGNGTFTDGGKENSTTHLHVPHRRPGGVSKLTPWDYFHINSVQPFEDGYIVNSRAMWSVFKINKDGSVAWRLQGEDGGDFTLDDDIFFSWQHDSRVIASTPTTLQINLFNNDNSGFQKRKNTSNFQSLEIDLESRRVTQLRKLGDPKDELFAMAMGNWQALPNNRVMVSYGYGGGFKEFNEDDEVVFSANFGSSSFHSFTSSFAVFRHEWHAEPDYPPKAASEYDQDEDLTTVWMSWNGATDYDQWALYAGSDENELRFMGSFAREGFETEVTLLGLYEKVQVEAWQKGESRRKSEMASTTVLDRYQPDLGNQTEPAETTGNATAAQTSKPTTLLTSTRTQQTQSQSSTSTSDWDVPTPHGEDTSNSPPDV